MSNQTTINVEPNSHAIEMIREFDAPRELVFKAYTDPDLLVQWLGPRRLTMKIDTFDARTGGGYRYIHIDEQGNEFGFHGVIHELAPNERIIQTFEFEGLPETGHVSMETATFETLPGDRTRVRTVSVFQSVADRDGMAASGMEEGIYESYERLDEVLATRR